MKYLTIWVSLVTTVAADSFFLVGRGESSTPKQRVKNHLSINRRGGSGEAGGCDAGSPARLVPTPNRVFQLSGDSGILAEPQFHNSLPSILFQLLEGCLSLMQMRPAPRLWLQKREEGGRREFRGHRAGGKLDQLPEKKNALGSSAAVFCSSYMKCALFLRVKILTACVP